MPPTDCTLLAVKCLPQIAQIFTDAAFKGVHLSQVHQPSNVDMSLATLLHFLLWQAAKPSGDKCTPLKAVLAGDLRY